MSVRALPSSDHAAALLSGDASPVPADKLVSLAWVMADVAGRALLLGMGMAAAGIRGKQLMVGAIGGALAVEAFVLAWFLLQRPTERVAS